jgi:hypothetical protein
VLTRVQKWSGVRESNSPHELGRLRYYHYTNPAKNWKSVGESNSSY